LALAGTTAATGGGPLERGADLVGLDLGDRSLVAFGGLPAALAESPGDHDPVALGRESSTAMPLLVKRSSGSSTRLPTMVVWLSAAMLMCSLLMLVVSVPGRSARRRLPHRKPGYGVASLNRCP
jgi:hypothetical protein